jgi:hypothetical protein
VSESALDRCAVLSALCVAALLSACGGGGGSGSSPASPVVAGPTPAPAPAPSPAPSPAPAPGPTPAPPHGDHAGPHIDTTKIPVAVVGFSQMRIAPSSDTPSPGGDTGQFRITCTYSHMNFDDPIVAPGRPGASHLHTFFGNTGITAHSTADTIESSGNSTCAGGIANRSGYWVPAVVDTRDGRPLAPTDILVYYKSDPLPGARVRPFPRGLRMVAGDAMASGPSSHMDWGCLSDAGETRGPSIPAACAAGLTVEMTVSFPACWDGVNLDSPDHKSHMAYPVADRTSPTGMGCPSSHPVQLPVITEKVRYRVAESDSTAHWRLSSDRYADSLPGGYSAHADWFNGWHDPTQQIWISRCLQANRDCHGYLLGDGTTLF